MIDKPLTYQRILHLHRAEAPGGVGPNGTRLSETNHGTCRLGENPGGHCLPQPEFEGLSKNPSKTECPRGVKEFLPRPTLYAHPELFELINAKIATKTEIYQKLSNNLIKTINNLRDIRTTKQIEILNAKNWQQTYPKSNIEKNDLLENLASKVKSRRRGSRFLSGDSSNLDEQNLMWKQETKQ